ncbi:MAG: 2-methylcitrate dehydratase, partial [bacterium]|nr:2-methylcitrate dehydratase [bacterium]
GHRRRRAEGIPLLEEKFRSAVATRFTSERPGQIAAAFETDIPVHRFVDTWVS